MDTSRLFKQISFLLFIAATCVLLPSCANKQPKLYKYKKPKKEKIMRDDTRGLINHLQK